MCRGMVSKSAAMRALQSGHALVLEYRGRHSDEQTPWNDVAYSSVAFMSPDAASLALICASML